MDQTKALIKKQEGLRLDIYTDSLGFPTVGYGHALHIGSYITQDIADRLFELDFAVSRREYHTFVKKHGLELDTVRESVITNMIYNLGRPRLNRFKKMIAALQAKDWKEAAAQMMDSLWADQVKSRAVILAKMMKTGEY